MGGGEDCLDREAREAAIITCGGANYWAAGATQNMERALFSNR
jgi:hypothetical protein